VHSGPHPPNEATAMLLCSVRARHDALGSVAEGSACDAVVGAQSLIRSSSLDRDGLRGKCSHRAGRVRGPAWRQLDDPAYEGLASSIARV